MDHLASLTSLSHFLLITYRYTIDIYIHIQSQANPFSRNLNTLYPNPTYICISDRYFSVFSSPNPPPLQISVCFTLPRRFPSRNAYRSFYLDNPTWRGLCASWLDRVSSLSPFFPPLEHRQKYTPSLPIYGMPISSTMLLILIYMTRPTATRNHRRVHRDGNYKFMYPSSPPHPVTGCSKKFPLRAICVPRSSSSPLPLSIGFVSCFSLFFFFFFTRPFCCPIC